MKRLAKVILVAFGSVLFSLAAISAPVDTQARPGHGGGWGGGNGGWGNGNGWFQLQQQTKRLDWSATNFVGEANRLFQRLEHRCNNEGWGSPACQNLRRSRPVLNLFQRFGMLASRLNMVVSNHNLIRTKRVFEKLNWTYNDAKQMIYNTGVKMPSHLREEFQQFEQQLWTVKNAIRGVINGGGGNGGGRHGGGNGGGRWLTGSVGSLD